MKRESPDLKEETEAIKEDRMVGKERGGEISSVVRVNTEEGVKSDKLHSKPVEVR